MFGDVVQELLAPIFQVTLLEDRAQVQRCANILMPKGLSRWRVSGVSPVLSDKSLSAHWEEVTGLRLVDLVVERRRLQLEPELLPGVVAAREDLRRLRQEVADLEDERHRLDVELNDLNTIWQQYLDEVADDAAHGVAEADEWSLSLNHLQDAREVKLAELEEAQEALADKRLALQEREARQDDRHEARSLPRASLLLTFQAAADCEVELVLNYLVPCACWRPRHRAEMLPGTEQLRFSCEAAVWQNTGEDWQDVSLVFSTRRLLGGVEPPPLSEDVLQFMRRRGPIEVAERAAPIWDSGAGQQEPDLERVAELPGIDDAGRVLNVRAPELCTVPSDGRPSLVHLCHFETAAEGELVTLPEFSHASVWRTLQANQAPQPLLAGPVDLYRDGGYRGRARLLYVNQGETFALGWGPDPQIYVVRQENLGPDDAKLLSSWVSRRHEIVIRVSNLGPEPRNLLICERLPVAEIDQVQVEYDEERSSAGAKPDDNGFLGWEVALEPFGHAERRYAYSIRRHEDVVGI